MKLSPAGDWVTLAGNNTQVTGSDDGMGTAARFNNPTGLALDRDGNLFVADTGNHTIRKISPDGRVSTVAGMAPQGTRLVDAVGAAARFSANFALAADGSGQIYVADGGNNVVRHITPDGGVSTFAGVANSYHHVDGVGSNARFYGPYSIAVDAGGNALTTDGTDLRTISKTAEVRTLALDSGGGVFGALADGGNGSWLAVTHFMWLTTFASAPTSNVLPSGSGAEPPINGSFAIRRVDQAGKATTLLDSSGTSDSLLSSANAQGFAPVGLAGDNAGRVVFTMGHAVFELSRDGVLSLLAGQMTESGSADGTGALARFASPAGLALDADGQIYVADSGNNTIRKITRSGVVSTILGRAEQPGISLGAAPGGLLEPRAVAIVPGGLVIASRQAVLLARP
jgi:sugar lactone lactonase YvrE